MTFDRCEMSCSKSALGDEACFRRSLRRVNSDSRVSSSALAKANTHVSATSVRFCSRTRSTATFPESFSTEESSTDGALAEAGCGTLSRACAQEAYAGNARPSRFFSQLQVGELINGESSGLQERSPATPKDPPKCNSAEIFRVSSMCTANIYVAEAAWNSSRRLHIPLSHASPSDLKLHPSEATLSDKDAILLQSVNSHLNQLTLCGRAPLDEYQSWDSRGTCVSASRGKGFFCAEQKPGRPLYTSVRCSYDPSFLFKLEPMRAVQSSKETCLVEKVHTSDERDVENAEKSRCLQDRKMAEMSDNLPEISKREQSGIAGRDRHSDRPWNVELSNNPESAGGAAAINLVDSTGPEDGVFQACGIPVVLRPDCSGAAKVSDGVPDGIVVECGNNYLSVETEDIAHAKNSRMQCAGDSELEEGHRHGRPFDVTIGNETSGTQNRNVRSGDRGSASPIANDIRGSTDAHTLRCSSKRSDISQVRHGQEHSHSEGAAIESLSASILPDASGNSKQVCTHCLEKICNDLNCAAAFQGDSSETKLVAETGGTSSPKADISPLDPQKKTYNVENGRSRISETESCNRLTDDPNDENVNPRRSGGLPFRGSQSEQDVLVCGKCSVLEKEVQDLEEQLKILENAVIFATENDSRIHHSKLASKSGNSSKTSWTSKMWKAYVVGGSHSAVSNSGHLKEEVNALREAAEFLTTKLQGSDQFVFR